MFFLRSSSQSLLNKLSVKSRKGKKAVNKDRKEAEIETEPDILTAQQDLDKIKKDTNLQNNIKSKVEKGKGSGKAKGKKRALRSTVGITEGDSPPIKTAKHSEIEETSAEVVGVDQQKPKKNKGKGKKSRTPKKSQGEASKNKEKKIEKGKVLL